MMWTKRVSLAVGVIIVLLAAALFAGETGRRLFITDTGRVVYNADSISTPFRVCKDVSEVDCLKIYFDEAGDLITDPILGGSLQQAFDGGTGTISGVTNSKPLALLGSTLTKREYELSGDWYSEVVTTATGDPIAPVTTIPSGLDYTIETSTQQPIFTFDDTTRTVSLASGATFTVPSFGSTLTFMADALYMQGCTLLTDGPIVAGGLVEPYITCGDNDAHGFHRSIEMPDSWDGNAISVTLGAVTVSTNPSGSYGMHFSAQCVKNSDTYTATIPTTGEQLVTLQLGTGCAGVCEENDRIILNTAAPITPTGTCTGTGRLLRVQGQIDATVTNATVEEVRLTGIKVHFTRNTLKDN